MRWHVHAEGDAPEGTHQDLAERLRKLLGQGRFGTDRSQFAGDQVNGPVHDPGGTPDPDAAADTGDAK
jgi:hypothetical protein